MSAIQGLALLWLRHTSLATVTLHGVEGARCDEQGIWHGLDDIDRGTYRRIDHWAADSDRLGTFLREALLASRYLVPVPQHWIDQGAGADRMEQNALLAAAFGKATARSLFTGMKSCVLRRQLDEVRFIPKQRRHGGLFDGFDPRWAEGHEDVVIRWSDPSDVWLEAARLCFSRCL